MGFDNECIVNIQSLPGEFFCPVCRTLVYPHEALQSQCTHLYCKPCLAYVVATTQACPYDGFLVTEADSKPLTESNKSVAESIGKVAVHCLYYRSGCQWQGTLTECTGHTTDCSFGNSLVVCNRCGAQIIHRQVQEHAQSCPGLQPQAQQSESTLTQVSSVPAQTTQATVPAAPTAAAATVPAAAAAAATTSTVTPASAAAAAPVSAPAAVQPQTVAQTPTADPWYQQQLQFQQYYQQYPGYDPYQQQYQQYQQQQVYQNYPHGYVQAPTQQQHVPYAVPQSQPQPQSHPQTRPPAPPQLPPQQSVPQPQPQYQPQAQAYPNPRPSQMHTPHTHVPPQQVQPQPQSYPSHLQYQPQPQTQQTAPAQPLPNMQPQHAQAQAQFQHPPQSNVPLQPRPQLQPQPQPQPQMQSSTAVSGYQSYPQPQPFQQFPNSAPLQPHMQIPLHQHGPPQQGPRFPPQQNSQFRPSHSHMQQQPTTMPPQGPWQMQQQQPPNMPPHTGQTSQFPPSMCPPVQQQLAHQPYQHAMHPPSRPHGMPHHQHSLPPQVPPSHQPQGPAGRLMMSNQGNTQQVALNQQVQNNLVPASPAAQPGISGQDMLDRKKSPKIADADKTINSVNGVTDGSKAAGANGNDGKEKIGLSDSQTSSKESKSLAEDEKVGVPEIKHEHAGEEGNHSRATEMNGRHHRNGITSINKEVNIEDEVANPSSADKRVASNNGIDVPCMQQQVQAPGRDNGLSQRPPHHDSIAGHDRQFNQPGYLDKIIPPEGPNSGPGRYPSHQVPLGNQPANPAQVLVPHGHPPDKSFPQQIPYPGKERKFMDPQFHQLPPPPGLNQTRPPMQHIPENFPPKGFLAPAPGAHLHSGPPRGYEHQVMTPQLHVPSHLPPTYDSGLLQGGPVAPPVMRGPPPGGFNSVPGRPDDHPPRSNYPFEAEALVMRHPTFIDGKRPVDQSGLHDVGEERLRPNPDGRLRPHREESSKIAAQEYAIPSIFEDDLRRFPQPSHLNGDPNFEAYALHSRSLDRGPQQFGHDPRSRSLDRVPYGADRSFGVGERRNHFTPPNDSERFRHQGDARGDAFRPSSEYGLHRLDGPPSSKFGSISQYYKEDFERRGASAFYDSRVPKHLGPGPRLLPPHVRRSDLDRPDNMMADAPDFPHSHFHESFRAGGPGFGRSYMLGDSFEYGRIRKPGSMGWCRICKLDCETVECLDMHTQTREHQKMAMDMVLTIKHEVSKKKKLSGGSFSPDSAVKSRKANFEHRGTRR